MQLLYRDTVGLVQQFLLLRDGPWPAV